MITRFKCVKLAGKGGSLKNLNNWVSFNNYGTYSI